MDLSHIRIIFKLKNAFHNLPKNSQIHGGPVGEEQIGHGPAVMGHDVTRRWVTITPGAESWRLGHGGFSNPAIPGFLIYGIVECSRWSRKPVIGRSGVAGCSSWVFKYETGAPTPTIGSSNSNIWNLKWMEDLDESQVGCFWFYDSFNGRNNLASHIPYKTFTFKTPRSGWNLDW